MAVNNGIITSIADFSEVGNVLQTSCLTTDNLCTHRNIKMWAKYKPTVYRGLYGGKTYGGNQWKATNGQCGIDFSAAVTTNTTPSNIASIVFNNPKAKWKYQPPTGGEVSPYRIHDFEGYNHNAECPINDPMDMVVYRNATGSCYEMQFDIDVNGNGDDDVLNMSDISYNGVQLKNFYLGIILNIKNRYVVGTTKTPIGETNSFSATIQLNNTDIGDCTVGLFLSNKIITLETDAQAGTVIIALPLNTATLTIRKGSGEPGGGTFVFWCDGCYGNGKATLFLNLNNYTANPQTSVYKLYIGRYKSGKRNEADNFILVKTTESITCAGGTSDSPEVMTLEYNNLTLPPISEGYFYCCQAVAENLGVLNSEIYPMEEEYDELEPL